MLHYDRDLVSEAAALGDYELFMGATNELGRDVESEWRNRDYNDDAFPEIVQKKLSSYQVHDAFKLDQFLVGLSAARKFPEQLDINENVGQPPFTLFVAPNFYISLLFWANSTTAIHDHGFCGAYSVAHGSSLNSEYDFKVDEIINGRLTTGRLRRKKAELLTKGSIRSILPGIQGAHSLFHLHHPSVTLLVRTYEDRREERQCTYHLPGFAVDPNYTEPTFFRKQQFLRMVRTCDERQFIACASAMLSDSDFETTFRILLYIQSLRIDDELMQPLLKAATKRHTRYSEKLFKLIECKQREMHLVELRKVVQEPDKRLMLAFLLNHVDCREAVQILKKLGTEEPEEVISRSLDFLIGFFDQERSDELRLEIIRALVGSQDLSASFELLKRKLNLTDAAEVGDLSEAFRLMVSSPVVSNFFEFQNYALTSR